MIYVFNVYDICCKWNLLHIYLMCMIFIDTKTPFVFASIKIGTKTGARQKAPPRITARQPETTREKQRRKPEQSPEKHRIDTNQHLMHALRALFTRQDNQQKTASATKMVFVFYFGLRFFC